VKRAAIHILIRYFTIAVSCLFFQNSAIAQQVVHNSYSLNEGLMSQTVYCALQDKDGYMWFGTDAGVSKFDGLFFENYTTNDGLCDNEVLRIEQDSKGRIWFLTLSGCVAYYYNGKIRSALNDKNLFIDVKTNGMTTMLEDKKGNIWFTGIGHEVLMFDGVKIEKHYLSTQDIGSTEVNVYEYLDMGNEICFSTLFTELKPTGNKICRIIDQHNLMIVPNCVYRDNDKTIGLVNSLGLINMADKSVECHLSNEELLLLKHPIGLSVFDGSYWLPSSELGVYKVTPQPDGRNSISCYFPNDWINFVYVDLGHNYWFCTRDRGVYCIPVERQNQYHYDIGHAYQATFFSKSDGDALFFGTSEGEIYHLDVESLSPARILYNTKAKGGIESLFFDGAKCIYSLTNSGVLAISFDADLSVTSAKKLFGFIPKTMDLDRNGMLYLGFLSGVAYVDTKENAEKWIALKEIIPSRIYSLCASGDGKLWYENHDKLFCLDQHINKTIDSFNNRSKGRVSSISELNSGIVVVSTMGSGLYFLKNENIIAVLARENGLPSNECEWVRVFENEIFAMTSGGLVSFQLAGNLVQNLKVYTQSDGLPNAKLYDVFVNEEQMFLATHLGVYLISRKSTGQFTAPPMLRLVGINGIKSDSTLSHINSRYKDNLKIDFTAFSFDLPGLDEFQYLFEGEGQDWQTTRSRSLEFSSLNHGNHLFKLRARKYNSDWSEPIVCSIYIKPPYWAAGWFVGISFFIAAGLIYLIITYVVRRKIRRRLVVFEQEQALLKERNRISTDLHDDLGAELSNIVILSRIARSKIKSYADPSEYIAKIDHSANEVISKMNGIIWSLNPVNDNLLNLTDYIQKYANDFLELNDLQGNVVINGMAKKINVKALTRRNVFLIVKEALHNVVKHSGANKVDILMDIQESSLEINITDNGKGFNIEEEKTEGLGLRSIKKRAADMGALLQIESRPGKGCNLHLFLNIDRDEKKH
jgi:signal transduction histidine kinase/ligand-binding sensor domain-containing protein